MNAPIIVAGLAAAFITIGHFTIGSKQYLKPMLRASFDDLPKKMNHCVFHMSQSICCCRQYFCC